MMGQLAQSHCQDVRAASGRNVAKHEPVWVALYRLLMRAACEGSPAAFSAAKAMWAAYKRYNSAS